MEKTQNDLVTTGTDNLTMKERKANIKILAPRYKQASKKEKKNILDEFVLNNGYTRSYASFVLRTYRIKCYVQKSNVVLLAEKNTQSKQKNHLIIYDATVKRYLVLLWRSLNYLCGKRMAPYLSEYIDKLEQCGELTLDSTVKKKLKQISAATIDRLLKDEKDRYRIKRWNHTKPGRLIKREIEVRKGISWDENQPGFLEIDLVGHEGGDPSGEFAFTLDATDVCTQWTETRTIRNKAAIWVVEAIEDIRLNLPFPLLGIDTDNGSEFLNRPLLAYCQDHSIKFTRGRSLEKNDSCHIEQKNYSIVQDTFGYHRYDTEKERNLMKIMNEKLRLYTNFFQPSMKLTGQKKINQKSIKMYDKAKTPFQRILDHSLIQEEAKQFLKQLYENLNPIKLRKEIVAHKRDLFQLVKEKNKDKIDYVSKEEYEKIYLSQKQNKETAHESTI